MKEKLKVVTIGGGSSYTPELMEGFINRYHELPISELWLVDVKAGEEKQNIIYNLCKRMIEKAGLDIKLYQTLDRRKALVDADFVTTQLRVGQLDARVLDERIPLSHGVIGQETNGPGGLFKGLRTIPVILDIVKDVEELCPDAWIINFTNPAGMVTEAINTYTSFKKFIGVCNVPVGMKMSCANLLNADYNDCEMDIFGLNHMIFMRDFYVNGVSRFDELIQITLNGNPSASSVNNVIDLQFDQEFIRGLNLIPCPYHRYYFKEKEMTTLEMAEYYKGETRAEQVKKLEAELFELYKDENLAVKPEQLSMRGGAHYSDAACELISAIYNDKQTEQYVNVPNNGHVKNIGHDWSIEVPAKVGKDGAIITERVTEFDDSVLGLISSIKYFEINASKAAVTGDYNQALVALNINPLIHSDDDAHIILDEMMDAHKVYLSNFYPDKK